MVKYVIKSHSIVHHKMSWYVITSNRKRHNIVCHKKKQFKKSYIYNSERDVQSDEKYVNQATMSILFKSNFNTMHWTGIR